MVLFPIGNFLIDIGSCRWHTPRPLTVMKTVREIGEFVAATRKSQGATQLDLAQMAGVGRRFVVELEAGKDSLHVGKVLRVLETLGADLSLEEPRGV